MGSIKLDNIYEENTEQKRISAIDNERRYMFWTFLRFSFEEIKENRTQEFPATPNIIIGV